MNYVPQSAEADDANEDDNDDDAADENAAVYTRCACVCVCVKALEVSALRCVRVCERAGWREVCGRLIGLLFEN